MTIPATQSEPAPAPIPEPRAVRNVEIALGWILRCGVIISISLVVIGTCLSFYHHPEYLRQSYPLQHPRGTDALTVSEVGEGFPHTLSQTAAALGNMKGQGFVVLGLLVLLATPVISVAVAIVAFAVQKDRAFAVIASIVLLILIVSFFLGRGEGG